MASPTTYNGGLPATDVLARTPAAANLVSRLHARSDDARPCVFALPCATTLWNAHGSGKLLRASLSNAIPALSDPADTRTQRLHPRRQPLLRSVAKTNTTW
ncbi:hypothetical protein K438DRAFT_1980156 [Mycena galopus ATCC 62051]|nr:hypothetical protein K438DRAFT_1980156 [Mycena galopus ATCC 62051]